MSASPIELLSPAKNAEIGIAAIDHGADAVYIGGPAFGARAGAENSLADIERLVAHAHRFSAQVFVAFNTILTDAEIDQAAPMIRRIHEAGADALIVQDMGLLELDLPPIALHASTQTDIRSPEKARFLQDVGFSQIVLARELSLPQIREIRAHTGVALEFFIHGALCVAYSGQCYISHAHTGRSANRGECSQACRLPYSLSDADGTLIAENKHLLSMKDNDQSRNLRALIDAGIRSFKIEGRLKDINYVKNITAHYRLLLDEILDDPAGGRGPLRRASAGRTRFFFTPDPNKTFNRGATDYFIHDRQDEVGAFDTPKFAGESLGRVSRVGRDHFELATAAVLHNGDGVSYFGEDGELVGLRINRAEPADGGWRLFPGDGAPPIAVGCEVFRNLDRDFERQLEKKSAERRIGVVLRFSETPEGFALAAVDEDGIAATAAIVHPHQPAQHAERATATLREHLGKLGNTIFRADDIVIDTGAAWFLPASVLNALRREAIEGLEAARRAARTRPPRLPAAVPPAPYPQTELSYLGNVFNARARAFYARHGVTLIEDAYEANQEKGAVSLMITKHCLRYSFNLCPKQVPGTKPEPMVLASAGEKLTLRFDCKRCEMHVVGKLKPGRRIRF